MDKCLFCGKELKFYDGVLDYKCFRCDYCKVDYLEDSINMHDKESWKLIEEHLRERGG